MGNSTGRVGFSGDHLGFSVVVSDLDAVFLPSGGVVIVLEVVINMSGDVVMPSTMALFSFPVAVLFLSLKLLSICLAML